eukprot:Colp12_sorted_trinity150504_noHs@9438
MDRVVDAILFGSIRVASKVGYVLVITVLGLIIYCTVCFYVFVLPSLPILWLQLIWSIWVAINVLGHTFLAAFRRPGHPRDLAGHSLLQGENFCDHCKTIKPERTHHCSQCNRCVLKYDHHCTFLNNCIGHRNHRHFVCFQIYLILACIYVVACGLPLYLGGEYEIGSVPERHVKATLLLTGITSVMLPVLLVGHMRRVANNMTAVEEARRNSRGEMKRHRYDLGWRRNLSTFFLTNNGRWYNLFHPYPLQPAGDGSVWLTVLESHQ